MKSEKAVHHVYQQNHQKHHVSREPRAEGKTYNQGYISAGTAGTSGTAGTNTKEEK